MILAKPVTSVAVFWIGLLVGEKSIAARNGESAQILGERGQMRRLCDCFLRRGKGGRKIKLMSWVVGWQGSIYGRSARQLMRWRNRWREWGRSWGLSPPKDAKSECSVQ